MTAPVTRASATERMSNDDLRWDGTAFGLQPRIANPATAQIVNDDAVADDDLRARLRDPQRFAIAHVILTMRSRKIESFDANQWNDLHVMLDASGTARYEPADMPTLVRRWGSQP